MSTIGKCKNGNEHFCGLCDAETAPKCRCGNPWYCGWCGSVTAPGDKDGPIVENAVACTICHSPADRYAWGFQCQADSCHVGDLVVGIFSDLTPPTSEKQP